MEFNDLVKIVKKLEPFIALAVAITLIYLAVLLYQDNNLKQEIAQTCGYDEGEDYTCYCQKGFILEKYLELERREKGDDFLNVQLAG